MQPSTPLEKTTSVPLEEKNAEVQEETKETLLGRKLSAPSSPTATLARHDFLFKMILMGDSKCGKTSLLNRFVDDAFSSLFLPTIGVDFKTKIVHEIQNTALTVSRQKVPHCILSPPNGIKVHHPRCSHPWG